MYQKQVLEELGMTVLIQNIKQTILKMQILSYRLFVEPLGHFLGVSRRKPPVVADNTVLENAYKHHRKISPDKVKVSTSFYPHHECGGI